MSEITEARIRTADAEYVSKGDRVFNYYDGVYCVIVEDPDYEGWFDTESEHYGGRGLRSLNGERICTVAYAEHHYPNGKRWSLAENLRSCS